MTRELIFHCEFGSTVYGTRLPSSDTDYKAIYMPQAPEILLGNYDKVINETTKVDIHSKSSADDIETEIFSLKEYMRLLLEGQTVALTMLYMPGKHILHHTPQWEEIHENKSSWIHSGVAAFAGYCRTQANKYGIKGSRVAAARQAVDFFEGYHPQTKLRDIWGDIQLFFFNLEHCEFITTYTRGNAIEEELLSVCDRKVQKGTTVKNAYDIYKRVLDEYGQRALQAESNEGVDWKACMHAVRVAAEAYELLLTGYITYPRPEAELLLKIRQGELPYKQVAERIEQGLIDLDYAQGVSKLPSKPDHAKANSLLIKAYGSQVCSFFNC